MTTAKRLGLTTIALILVGAGAAYYATVMALRTHGWDLTAWRIDVLVLALVAALATLVLLVFWRSLHRSVNSVGRQLQKMADDEQVGLVMIEDNNELAYITRPLNEYLTMLMAKMETLRGENRELHIQSRIASAEKNHTEAIIFSISDAVIVTNRFDELVLANEAAERLLGFKSAPSLRKNIDRIMSDTTLIRLIRETRSHGGNALAKTRKVVEHTIDDKGMPRIFTITLSCVMAVNDEVSGVVAVLHDVTREKEIARMKNEFVSNVSHEFKTPLASIKAYVEMLVDGEARDEDTQKEFYDIIQSETNRLTRLIENILNISRIESGVVKVVKEPLSLTGVVKQMIDVVLPQARAKNQKIVERLAPVYYQVEADHDMIRQAVLNLLSNAIKYTSDGGTITLAVTVDERRDLAVCDITDTGAGIPAEDLPHIFDKFYRVRANSKMAKGTGLGLTLVKHIVETVHGGRLTVTSEAGAGSTFTFELPVLR